MQKEIIEILKKYSIPGGQCWKPFLMEEDYQKIAAEISSRLDALVIRQTAEELSKVINAGNNLAEATHYLQKEYDGINRIRLALSEWYKVRADEFGRDKSSLSV